MRYFLLALVLIISSCQQCPLKQSEWSQVTSDSISLVKIRQRDELQYNYEFIEPFNSVPVVGVGLNQFDVSESILFDIEIINPMVQNSFALFKISNSSMSWSKLKINFLASTRPDIDIGFAQTTQPNYISNNFTVQYPIKVAFRNSSSLRWKTFIQSISMESVDKQFIGLHLKQSGITNKTLRLEFLSPNNQSRIRYLQVTVIIFDTNSPGVYFAEGEIAQNFLVSKLDIAIPRHGVNELRTYIVGISSFYFSIAQPINLLAEVNDKFSLVIGPLNGCQIDFVAVSYLILSVVDCGYCTGHPFSFNSTCLAQCPPGTVLKNSQCLPVDCVKGYILNSLNQCVPSCPTNQQYIQGQCQCPQPLYLINNTCQSCPQGTYYNFRTLECSSVCGANSVYSNGKCYCLKGFYIIDGRCDKCPQGHTFDMTLRKCLVVCQYGQSLVNGQCQCPRGQVWKGVQQGCVCGVNQVWSTTLNQCVCIEYFTRRYGLCVRNCPNGTVYNQTLDRCLPICQSNEYLSDRGQCQCLPNYYRTNGSCQLCPTGTRLDPLYNKCVSLCPTNQRYLNNQCVCLPNFYRINKQCVQCLTGYSYSFQVQRCVPLCGSNEVMVGDTCVCGEGYYRIEGKCSQCPLAMRYDSIKGQCVQICGSNEVFYNGVCYCKPGYYRIDRQCIICPLGTSYSSDLLKCIPLCSSNQLYHSPSNKCICIQGYYRINNICQQCPINTSYNQSLQRCLPLCPDSQYFDLTLNKCLCQNGLYLINSQCQSCPYGTKYNPSTMTCIPLCPQNQHYINNNCQCLPNYFRLTNSLCAQCPSNTFFNPTSRQCQPYCPANQQFINGQCTCLGGYYLIDNKCQQCSYPSFYYNGKCLDCSSNANYLNGQCVCNVGYYMVEGKCINCRENQIWNGLQCTCIDGYTRNIQGYCLKNYIPTCSGLYQQWDPKLNSCVCRTNYALISGQCRLIANCDQFSYWNGFKCQCLSGYVYSEAQGRCIRQVPSAICPLHSTFNGVFCCCDPGYYPIVQRSCSQCPIGQYWNGKCCTVNRTCETNYFWDQTTASCRPIIAQCGLNQRWNGVQCQCLDMYDRVNGVCQQCPSNSFFDGRSCVYGRNYCPQSNQIWNGQQCICANGYFMVENKCVTCPSWTVWNGARCLPKDNFNCPDGAVFVNGQCIFVGY